LKKVFISTTSFAQFSKEPLEILKSNGFNFELNEYGRKMGKSDCLEIYSKYDGIVAGTEIFDKQVLDSAENLKVISRVGVGLDNIDIEYAKQRGIKIYRSKTEPSLAVAELVLGLILDLTRKISLHNKEMKSGTWHKKMGSLLSGKTLGIIGLGNIGKTLVKITHGLSLNILAYDIIRDQQFAEDNNIKYCDLEYLLQSSDIISIHSNYNANNENMISNDQFSLMKDSAIFINTSRGELVNEKDLYETLKQKKIAGAGIDVFKEEPYSGNLTILENIIVTPHIAAYGKEVRIKMEMEAVTHLIEGLSGS